MTVLIDAVIDSVAEAFRVPREAILGRRRTSTVILARHSAYWLARALPERPSFPEIATVFGDRHHSTVLSGCRRIDQMVLYDARLRQLLADARAIFAKGQPDRAALCGGFIAGFDTKGRAYDFLHFERDDLDPCAACRQARGRHVLPAEVANAA